ncbi:MAG: hypothetical protein AAF984_02370 [Verrucomicrobiota bacterium]
MPKDPDETQALTNEDLSEGQIQIKMKLQDVIKSYEGIRTH